MTFPSGKLRIVSGKEFVGSDKLVDFFEKEMFLKKGLDRHFILCYNKKNCGGYAAENQRFTGLLSAQWSMGCC